MRVNSPFCRSEDRSLPAQSQIEALALLPPPFLLPLQMTGFGNMILLIPGRESRPPLLPPLFPIWAIKEFSPPRRQKKHSPLLSLPSSSPAPATIPPLGRAWPYELIDDLPSFFLFLFLKLSVMSRPDSLRSLLPLLAMDRLSLPPPPLFFPLHVAFRKEAVQLLKANLRGRSPLSRSKS